MVILNKQHPKRGIIYFLNFTNEVIVAEREINKMDNEFNTDSIIPDIPDNFSNESIKLNPKIEKLITITIE